MKTLIKNIGEISFKSLRDTILDYCLTGRDTIVLHPINFDNIVIEHREIYGESIQIPFFCMGVEIIEDKEKIAVIDKILIFKGDETSIDHNRSQKDEYPPLNTFYRFGWCGNVVDFDGNELSPENRNEKIGLLKKFGNSINVKKVTGYCCNHK